MKKKNYAQKKAEQFIQAALNMLVRLYQKCLLFKEYAQLSEARFIEFVTGNSEFEEMRLDARETGRMFALIILVILTAIIDYVLTYQAFDILCSTVGLHEVMKVIGPVILVLLEIFISYSMFTAMYRRGSAYGMSWFDRVLPYSVILIIIGLSLGVILYSMLNLADLPGYSMWTIIIQIVLLIASILLHICIIKNAVDIGEMFTFQQYRLKRNVLSARKQRDQKRLNKEKGRFLAQTRGTVRNIYEFQGEFPNSSVDFTISLPTEVVNAIVVIMGKDVFRDNNNQSQIPD